MKYEVLSVYDSKAHCFMKPFFTVNLQVGVRMFADVANDPDQLTCRNSEDFTLFHLGSWEDSSATFTAAATPISLGLAQAFKR